MSFITTPRIDVKTLKCKGESCDFYGNQQWNGYCSKCKNSNVMRNKILAESKFLNLIPFIHLNCAVTVNLFYFPPSFLQPIDRKKFQLISNVTSNQLFKNSCNNNKVPEVAMIRNQRNETSWKSFHLKSHRVYHRKTKRRKNNNSSSSDITSRGHSSPSR
jgi:A20-like zinc finger